ncbi:hypothetical protein PROFUN_16511 [Planoprotostelium fungivorum]|uniref:Uncharacterized protein n=1 Tax=Planoprotostelium fungivorum TaxID=1890364 RepID=A0A2P6MQB2_9EUKA|nr:hypothetical protein PROFUN_16511 [Planoprotostelium fungivorum]
MDHFSPDYWNMHDEKISNPNAWTPTRKTKSDIKHNTETSATSMAPPRRFSSVPTGYYFLVCKYFYLVCIKHALSTQKLINVLQRIYKLMTGSKHSVFKDMDRQPLHMPLGIEPPFCCHSDKASGKDLQRQTCLGDCFGTVSVSASRCRRDKRVSCPVLSLTKPQDETKTRQTSLVSDRLKTVLRPS